MSSLRVTSLYLFQLPNNYDYKKTKLSVELHSKKDVRLARVLALIRSFVLDSSTYVCGLEACDQEVCAILENQERLKTTYRILTPVYNIIQPEKMKIPT